MGRILGYVVLLSNLSLILGAAQGNGHERGSLENFTHPVRQYFPREKNDFSNRKLLPVGSHGRRRPPQQNPKQMLSSVGLHAYASPDHETKHPNRTLRFSDLTRRSVLPPYSQGLYPRRNPKAYPQYFPSQKLSRLNGHAGVNDSLEHHKRTDGFNRRHHPGRNARYHYSPKVCEPCNSVPWIPLLKVPDSYRQQRTHLTELHPTPQQNFNFDFHGFSSNAHNVLLPPVPLSPPIGTISSSFGLPIGNIPTGHGLLAPISHLSTDVNHYSINTVDYSNSFNYYSPPGLLENNNFPELSPVPVVPIHDSGQFYQFDSAIPDLVPPPAKPLDVSNVVLTISEEQTPPEPLPPNHKNSPPDLAPQSSAVDFHATRDNNPGKDFGRLEIVKSIPLAEFKASVDSRRQQQQQLPLYPPLQSEFPEEPKNDFHHPDLRPPPADHQNVSGGPAKTGDAKEEASAPKPLTGPSLSWLFSDHTAPPSDSKTTISVSSFATGPHEIASVVNDELRPVSPHPVPLPTPPEQNIPPSKGKKIQIIIPYTTKSKSGHDNNALESVRHEVFQPPVSKSTKENNSSGDSATSVRPPSTRPSGKSEHEQGERYLSEMHHIIASNIRELLREEIEKSQKEQNYPLQNNIDNWTALEYSNHKTVSGKAPKEIIAQALAVTSIPGTSISHLLLPSKKIPSEYFVTTPLPEYEEASSSAYRAENSSVNSRPFTAKPYATTNVYNPTKGNRGNHERNRTEADRGRVNAWGRVNENLVVAEGRSRTRAHEQTTASSWTAGLFSRSAGSEKVQIVTPTPQRNHTTTPFRRTTRHARTTETPGKPTRRPTFLNRLNSTRLEKVSNLSSDFERTLANVSTTVRPANSSGRPSPEESKGGGAEGSGGEAAGPQKGGRLSINDIFPFRNKELPWESNQNGTQPALRIGRQRKSLIKQVNLQKSKAAVGSS